MSSSKSVAIQLAVFPLPLVLLPGGITRLRIFEQRYIRMVKEAAQGQGFALSLLTPSAEYQTSSVAAWVEIIDFATLPDGLLSIDVRAKCLIELSDICVEHDGLRRASVTPTSHWPEMPHSSISRELGDHFKLVLQDNEQLAAFYPNPQLDSPVWICQRWLEILPVTASCKATFLTPDSFSDCLNLLSDVLLEENVRVY